MGENLSRRRFLRTASAAASTVTLPAGASAHPALAALIQTHRAAEAEYVRLSAVLQGIADANPLPRPQVQYGRTFTGRVDGQEVYRPLYAVTEAKLREAYGQHADFHRRWNSPKGEAVALTIEAQRDAKIADLRRQQEANRAARDACGLTAAEDAAENASMAAFEAWQAIMRHQFTALDELREAIRYVAEYERGVGGPVSEVVGQLAMNFAGLPLDQFEV